MWTRHATCSKTVLLISRSRPTRLSRSKWWSSMHLHLWAHHPFVRVNKWGLPSLSHVGRRCRRRRQPLPFSFTRRNCSPAAPKRASLRKPCSQAAPPPPPPFRRTSPHSQLSQAPSQEDSSDHLPVARVLHRSSLTPDGNLSLGSLRARVLDQSSSGSSRSHRSRRTKEACCHRQSSTRGPPQEQWFRRLQAQRPLTRPTPFHPALAPADGMLGRPPRTNCVRWTAVGLRRSSSARGHPKASKRCLLRQYHRWRRLPCECMWDKLLALKAAASDMQSAS
mmetsp:Transcript_35330/g.82526  ORF Transcript_35330/g.82526 Transcript_35330/m.82526 type:complete len:279 (+) Transcript_35330:1106-1942(+)